MFPIPDPSRLFPPKLPPSGGSDPRPGSLAKGLLVLGGAGILLAITIGGGALASALHPWLAIPGGLLGFGLGSAIMEAPLIFLGIIDALFYFGMTYLFSGGFERPDPAQSLIYAGIVALAFLWATFSARKEH